MAWRSVGSAKQAWSWAGPGVAIFFWSGVEWRGRWGEQTMFISKGCVCVCVSIGRVGVERVRGEGRG